MHLYADVHGEYWVGSEEATSKYDLELVQEAGG